MSIKIMFVDDDENLLEGLKRSLRKKVGNWKINFNTSGKKALEILNKERYNIIITDYKMPEMDGMELLNIVRDKYPDVHRILLTGQSEKEIFEKAKSMDHLYLAKPCSTEDLISTINNVLL